MLIGARRWENVEERRKPKSGGREIPRQLRDPYKDRYEGADWRKWVSKPRMTDKKASNSISTPCTHIRHE
jgi:hypothetical protein